MHKAYKGLLPLCYYTTLLQALKRAANTTVTRASSIHWQNARHTTGMPSEVSHWSKLQLVDQMLASFELTLPLSILCNLSNLSTWSALCILSFVCNKYSFCYPEVAWSRSSCLGWVLKITNKQMTTMTKACPLCRCEIRLEILQHDAQREN